MPPISRRHCKSSWKAPAIETKQLTVPMHYYEESETINKNYDVPLKEGKDDEG